MARGRGRPGPRGSRQRRLRSAFPLRVTFQLPTVEFRALPRKMDSFHTARVGRTNPTVGGRGGRRRSGLCARLSAAFPGFPWRTSGARRAPAQRPRTKGTRSPGRSGGVCVGESPGAAAAPPPRRREMAATPQNGSRARSRAGARRDKTGATDAFPWHGHARPSSSLVAAVRRPSPALRTVPGPPVQAGKACLLEVPTVAAPGHQRRQERAHQMIHPS